MKHKLLRASLTVSIAMLLLRLFGFIREIVLASTFGAGVVSDAYVLAMNIPTVVLAIFTATVSTIFIPQYQSIEKDKDKFSGNVVSLLFIVGLIFSVIFTVFPEMLVYLFASQLPQETFDITVLLLRIMVWSSIPMLLIGVFRAYLQIKSLFFISLISDALVNVATIIALFVTAYSNVIFILGIGAVVGNVLSLSLLMVVCYKKGFRVKLGLNTHDPRLKAMLLLMLPLALSQAVQEINQILNRNFASMLDIGTVSSLNYAEKICAVLITFVGMSVATAMYPEISKLAAEGNLGRIKNRLLVSVNTLLPLLLPATVGVIILAKPIIHLFLERGAFDAEDTVRTSQCLQMYALGIIGTNLCPLVGRVFNAMKDTKRPAIISAVSVVIGIILNILLISHFKHMGLAFATSASSTICAIILLFSLKRKIGHLGFRKQFGEYAKITGATAVMGVVVILMASWMPLLLGTSWECLLGLLLVIIIAVIVYGLMLLVFKAKTATAMLSKCGAQISKLKNR